MVVDTRSITTQLPEVIEAFFVQPDSSHAEREHVVQAHAQFLRDYPHLSQGARPLLLQLDLDLDGSPFSLAG